MKLRSGMCGLLTGRDGRERRPQDSAAAAAAGSERDVLVVGGTGVRGRARRAVAVRGAEELDGVGDDVDRLALVAAVGGPLAPLEATVDRDRPALGQESGAVLALGAPDGHIEVVGLVAPLAAGAVLAARVGRQPQAADAHAARGGAELGVARQVAGEHDAVDVGAGHRVLLLVGGESSCKLATAGPEPGWPTTHAPASGAQRSPRGATRAWPGGGWSGGWRPPGCRSGTLKRRRDSIRALTTEEP